jgi:peptidoglycan DL-endopeptidase CwlO
MTVASVTLADIQQTLAEMQQASASGPGAPGPAETASGVDTGFAADLDMATGASGASGTTTTSGSTSSTAAALADELLEAEALESQSAGGTGMAGQSDLLAVLLATEGAGNVGSVGSAGSVGSNTSLSPTTAATDATGSTAAGGVTGSDVVTSAESFEGVPYVWGGTSPSGFDCSGLVQYVYGQFGISLPRTSQEQSQVGTAVSSLGDAQPGDLLFFAGSDGTASAPGHVGIYIGNGQMVDAPHTGTSVQVQAVNPSSVVAIRRVIPSSSEPQGVSAQPTALGAAAASGTTQVGNVAVPNQYLQTIEQAASSNAIPASLLSALLYHESRFEPSVVSSAGAEGIAQFMPSTAAGMGVNPLDPTSSIEGAAQLLGSYTRQFGSYADALAAYDAGAGAVQRYGGVPPYAETQAYVPAVLSLAGLSGTGSGAGVVT